MKKKVVIILMVLLLSLIHFSLSFAENAGGVNNIEKTVSSGAEIELPFAYPTQVDYKIGVQYASEGRFDKAEEQFNKILKISNFYSAPSKIIDDLHKGLITEEYVKHFFRGESYKLDRKFQESITEYNKALEINPNYAAAYNNVAIVYSELKQFKEAIPYLDKAIERDFNYVSAYVNLGLVYYGLGEYQKAILNFEKAIKIDNSFAPAYNGLGLMFYDLKEYEKSINNFKKAIELFPNYDEAYSHLGLAYISLGQYQEALVSLEKAIEINPDLAVAYMNIALAYAYLNQEQKAIENLQKAKEICQKQGDAEQEKEVERNIELLRQSIKE